MSEEYNYEIVVVHCWTHPHYGGDRKNEYRFRLSDGQLAERKIREIEANIGSSMYEHLSFHISKVVERKQP